MIVHTLTNWYSGTLAQTSTHYCTYFENLNMDLQKDLHICLLSETRTSNPTRTLSHNNAIFPIRNYIDTYILTHNDGLY